MPVKSTYSSRFALGSILVALNPLAGLATESKLVAEGIRDELDEVTVELRKTRKGHELFVWEEEMDEVLNGEEV